MARKTDKEQMNLPGTTRKYRGKLDAIRVNSIRRLFHDGIPAHLIAQRQGITTTIVRRCVTGKTFTHYPGTKVHGSEFHRENALNLVAYKEARKLTGREPENEEVADVYQHLVAQQKTSASKVLIAQQENACNYCNGAPGTIPIKLVIEGRVLNEKDLCARCYGEFYHIVAGFFG